ncbi:MAG: 50S ribosomal protein L6 [Candidatus Pacearchaeota archaeon]|nr:50S ribosomal protein L6 [Candidatus Nealsonbacteria bacterium]MDZ4226685.1 50S ribosomal protein L6 [Candidatus Pacearchaeota archaeon]
MSRIGKKPIEIPKDVEIKIEGNRVSVKGKRGELSLEVRPEIKVEAKEGKVFVLCENQEYKAFWGLTRALIANIIQGVVQGYEKKLELVGVGYKVNVEGKDLVLNIGLSHPVKMKAPEGISFLTEKNIITISGIDKGLVGQTAASIRKIRPPEPYKGKGIKYVDEQIRRKEGKKAATSSA